MVVVFNDLKGVQMERHSVTRMKGKRKHTKSDPKYSITLSKMAKSSQMVEIIMTLSAGCSGKEQGCMAW